jgi:hypothetical protein
VVKAGYCWYQLFVDEPDALIAKAAECDEKFFVGRWFRTGHCLLPFPDKLETDPDLSKA